MRKLISRLRVQRNVQKFCSLKHKRDIFLSERITKKKKDTGKIIQQRIHKKKGKTLCEGKENQESRPTLELFYSKKKRGIQLVNTQCDVVFHFPLTPLYTTFTTFTFSHAQENSHKINVVALCNSQKRFSKKLKCRVLMKSLYQLIL